MPVNDNSPAFFICKETKKIDSLFLHHNFWRRASINSNIFLWRIRLVKIVLKNTVRDAKV
jgi:hypothetical protein